MQCRALSAEKQRLTIASVLSMNSNLLLLDEPTLQLDVQGKLELFAILDHLKQQGYTLIMAKHDPRSFSGLIDRYLVLEQGHLVETLSTLPNPGQYLPKSVPLIPAYPEHAAAVIDVQGLTLCYPETGEVLKQVDMRVQRGERVHLFGSNGAGKSSLLRCLAGLERPGSGRIRLAGIDSPAPRTCPGR